MKKKLWGILALLAIVGVAAFLVINFCIDKSKDKKAFVEEYIQKNQWTRFHYKLGNIEDMVFNNGDFYYDVVPDGQNDYYEVYDSYTYDVLTNNIILSEDDGWFKSSFKVVECGELYFRVKMDGMILDFMPDGALDSVYDYEMLDTSNLVTRYLKDHSGCYNIVNISEDKVGFQLPSVVEGYEGMYEEIALSDDVEFVKLDYLTLESDVSGEYSILGKKVTEYAAISKEEAVKEVEKDNICEFLWYNKKCEVEKIVFLDTGVKKLSQVEVELMELLTQWGQLTNQEFVDGKMHKRALSFDESGAFYCFRFDEEDDDEEEMEFEIDFDKLQINVTGDEIFTLDIVEYTDWYILFGYEGKLYEYLNNVYYYDYDLEGESGKYHRGDFSKNCEKYLEGFVSRTFLTKFEGDTLTLTPPTRDVEEPDIWQGKSVDRKVTSEAEYGILRLEDDGTKCEYEEMTREEAVNKIDNGESYACIWYNDELEVTKVVFIEE